MDDVLGVNVRYCVHHLREVPGGAGLAKPATLLKQLEQFPAWRQLENEVNPLRVMEPIIPVVLVDDRSNIWKGFMDDHRGEDEVDVIRPP